VDEAVPDEIMPNLYLSSAQFPRNKHAMKRRGITHVLTVAHIPPPHPNDFKYKLIDIDDHPESDLLLHFNECHEFIQEALDGGGAVAVHCAAGISRSATIVISYVMKTYRFSYKRAFEFVRQKRSVIRPNEGFVQQLHIYEKQLGIKSK
jgi:protein-tyrosine phosphatase